MNKVKEKVLDKIPDIDSTNSDDDIVLKVEETKKEKQTSAKTGDIYDPELDLSFYKYPKIDILDHIPDKKIQVTRNELESNKEKILETFSAVPPPSKKFVICVHSRIFYYFSVL